MGLLHWVAGKLFPKQEEQAQTKNNEEQGAAVLFVSPGGDVVKMTESALLLLGDRIHGVPLVDIIADETRRQILQELADRGLAPEKFSIDEVVADSIANGIDRQNWLIGKGVHKAVSAEIVPVYDSGGIAGYQIRFN